MSSHPALYRPAMVERNARQALIANARASMNARKPSLWARLATLLGA